MQQPDLENKIQKGVFRKQGTYLSSEDGMNRSIHEELTAAIEGLESSPGCGCVTSAPNIIVGMSLTRGMRRDSASTSTVFLPPTFTFIFNATLARYCLLILYTCLVKQH